MPPMFGVSIRYTIIKTFNNQLNTLLSQYFSSITHKPSKCLHYQLHTRLPTSLRQHSLTQPSLQQVQSLVSRLHINHPSRKRSRGSCLGLSTLQRSPLTHTSHGKPEQ